MWGWDLTSLAQVQRTRELLGLTSNIDTNVLSLVAGAKYQVKDWTLRVPDLRAEFTPSAV